MAETGNATINASHEAAVRECGRLQQQLSDTIGQKRARDQVIQNHRAKLTNAAAIERGAIAMADSLGFVFTDMPESGEGPEVTQADCIEAVTAIFNTLLD